PATRTSAFVLDDAEHAHQLRDRSLGPHTHFACRFRAAVASCSARHPAYPGVSPVTLYGFMKRIGVPLILVSSPLQADLYSRLWGAVAAGVRALLGREFMMLNGESVPNSSLRHWVSVMLAKKWRRPNTWPSSWTRVFT